MTELTFKPQILPLASDWREIHDLQTQFPTTFASKYKTGTEILYCTYQMIDILKNVEVFTVWKIVILT